MLVYSRLLRPTADEGLSRGGGTRGDAVPLLETPAGLTASAPGPRLSCGSRNALKGHAVAARPREAIANISDSSSENSFSHVQ
jgi:hypothetical protein